MKFVDNPENYRFIAEYVSHYNYPGLKINQQHMLETFQHLKLISSLSFNEQKVFLSKVKYIIMFENSVSDSIYKNFGDGFFFDVELNQVISRIQLKFRNDLIKPYSIRTMNSFINDYKETVDWIEIGYFNKDVCSAQVFPKDYNTFFKTEVFDQRFVDFMIKKIKTTEIVEKMKPSNALSEFVINELILKK